MADQEINIEKHDKRYHPNGYSEGSACKYRKDRDTSTEQKHSHQDSNSITPKYFDNLLQGLSISDIENWLQDSVGVECFHAEKAEDLRKKLFTTEELKFVFAYGGSPLNKEAYNLAVRTFGATVRDLKEKTPELYLQNQLFIPWDWDEKEGAIGKAQNDNREGNFTEPYISLGDMHPVFAGKCISDSYCPDKKLYPYAIARHEIGHSLSTDNIFSTFSVAKARIDRKMIKKGHDPLDEWKRWFGAERIANDIDEILAEIFQRTFAPDYNVHQQLPLGWQRIAKAMAEESARKMRYISVQDSKKQEVKMPFFNPSYQMCSWPTKKTSQKKNQWWDKAICQWVVFDDDKSADMLRYAASRVKIPPRDIETLIEEFPDRIWSSYDCNIIVSNWWKTSAPLESMKKHCKVYQNRTTKDDKNTNQENEGKHFWELWNKETV